MNYSTIPTNVGLAELAAAQVAGQVVPFTHIALGDGGGARPALDPAHAQLVHQVHLAEISSITRHPTEPNWFVFEAAVHEDVGGWTVREIALIGGRVPGLVMAVGDYPVTEKPAAGSGMGRALVVRMVVAFSAAAAASLEVSSQAYATAQSVLDAIALHEAKVDPHSIYLTKAEADAFYDSIGLAASAIAQDAARLSAHIAAADPHSQYLNAARLDQADRAAWAERFFYAAG